MGPDIEPWTYVILRGSRYNDVEEKQILASLEKIKQDCDALDIGMRKKATKGFVRCNYIVKRGLLFFGITPYYGICTKKRIKFTHF